MSTTEMEVVIEEPTLLDRARRLVWGDREASYGKPGPLFERVAQTWSAVLNHPVTAEEVVLCMACLKIIREANKPADDNRLDLAGYAAILDRVRRGT